MVTTIFIKWDGYDNEKDFNYDMYIEDTFIMRRMKDFYQDYFGKGYKEYDFIGNFDEFMDIYIEVIEQCKSEYETIFDLDKAHYFRDVGACNRELDVYLKGCWKQEDGKHPMVSYYY
jgi:hypothetical protein